MSIGAVLKQPLPYFVLAGVAVFLVDTWLRRESDVIRLTDGLRREVAAELATSLSRAPTDTELERGMESWVETELLFREATDLGLAENDAVIRGHLARKLGQLVQQRTIVGEPSDAELQAELDAQPQRYTKPDLFNVSHAFVNRNSSPETFSARVEEARAKLNAGVDLGSVGDHFTRGPKFEALSLQMLEGALGVKLGSVLKPEQVGKWQEVSGGRGAHFVRLDGIVSGRPTIENSRALLAEHINARKREAAARAFVTDLRRKFTVVDESTR